MALGPFGIGADVQYAEGFAAGKSLLQLIRWYDFVMGHGQFGFRPGIHSAGDVAGDLVIDSNRPCRPFQCRESVPISSSGVS